MPKGFNYYDLQITEFPNLVKYFENLLGKDRIKSIYGNSKRNTKPHFWYQYVKAFRKWKKGGSNIDEIYKDIKLIEFASHINAIKTYQEDWDSECAREEVIKRLRKADTVEGLLFEFHAGSHFLSQNLEVHWIANNEGRKKADLKVIAASGEEMLVECTFREPSFSRVIMDEEIIKDLLKSAEDKLESKHDYQYPRIIIVKIPENIDWKNIRIMQAIDKTINNWLSCGRMKSVNALLFMGLARMTRGSIDDGPLKRIAYEPDQTVYKMENPNPTYPLPKGINLVTKP